MLFHIHLSTHHIICCICIKAMNSNDTSSSHPTVWTSSRKSKSPVPIQHSRLPLFTHVTLFFNSEKTGSHYPRFIYSLFKPRIHGSSRIANSPVQKANILTKAQYLFIVHLYIHVVCGI